MEVQSLVLKRKHSDLEIMGKIPPQAIELEEAVLGAILLEKEALPIAMDILSTQSFYLEVHQMIFKSILWLFEHNLPVDMLTVSEQLKKDGNIERVGGVAFVSGLTMHVASSAHIEYHSRIIEQKYIQRQLIDVASNVLERAFDQSSDVNDLIDYNENELFKVTQGRLKKETLVVTDLLKSAIDRIVQASKKSSFLTGVPSGFSNLDKVTLGWQPTDLIIIAARPSMGKTAFVLSMASSMAIAHKKSVAIFSLEMSNNQLVDRLISGSSEIPSDKIRTGSLNEMQWRLLENSIGTLEKAPIYIDDTPALSIFELRAKCRRLKRKNNIDIIIIDYLQLMTANTGWGTNREQEVSSISRALKALAKELEVPIIALSQLNRSVESRTGSKRPQLSDLRESGAIEQDADIVAFIHRPEKYGFLQDEQGNSLKGIAEIIIAKHRNGALADLSLRFIDEYVKFVELDYGYSQQSDIKTFRSKMNYRSTAV